MTRPSNGNEVIKLGKTQKREKRNTQLYVNTTMKIKHKHRKRKKKHTTVILHNNEDKTQTQKQREKKHTTVFHTTIRIKQKGKKRQMQRWKKEMGREGEVIK